MARGTFSIAMVMGMVLVAGQSGDWRSQVEAKIPPSHIEGGAPAANEEKASGPKGGPFEALGKPELQGGAVSGPAVKEGDFVAKDFAFRDGEKIGELRLHYRTLGTPVRDSGGHVSNAVMILHGTGGTGAQFLAPQFADELFHAGQLLDTAK